MWIDSNHAFQLLDRRCVLLRVVVQPCQPVEVQRAICVFLSKLFEFRARPIPAVQRYIGHCQCEPAPIVERRNGFGLLQCRGGIEKFSVEEENACGQGQQVR